MQQQIDVLMSEYYICLKEGLMNLARYRYAKASSLYFDSVRKGGR
jgi:hypothetical protein